MLTKDPAEAADVIRRGGICSFPTETVYGLGANVFDETAVARIFEAKGRPSDNPLITHISDESQIENLASVITSTARKLIDAFFPGPLTVVLPKAQAIPMIATAGLETIAIRMPSFGQAQAFLRLCGVPVAAPSANLSGRPSPTTWQAVFEDLNGRIDCILQGDPTEIGLESTVVDCSASIPILLRKGSVSVEELRLVVPEIEMNEGSEIVRSPGMTHRHYSPNARVKLVTDPDDLDVNESSAFIGVTEPRGAFSLVRICSSVNEYARSLFAFFRECDEKGIKTIYCQEVAESGIGAAVMDRLRRAAEE